MYCFCRPRNVNSITSKIFHGKTPSLSVIADALVGKSSAIAVPQTISFAAHTIAYTTGDLF
jgi:hypothetical protein